MKPARCHRCGESVSIARGRTANGRWQVFWYCFDCNRRPQNTEFVPHKEVKNIDELPIAWDNVDPKEPKQPCAICFRLFSSAEIEYHHWAPRHLFGEEAEFWPGAMVCVPCHKRWHRLVTPVMSMPTAVSVILASLPADDPVAIALAKAEVEQKKAVARKVTLEQRDGWTMRRQKARLEAGEITQAEFDSFVTSLKLRKSA